MQQITLKYFNSKEEDPIQPLIPESPNPILKNLANSYFPKNNQNNIRNPQPKTNINGIWICNKPPGKKLKKENNDYWVEVIPIDLGLELDDWNYQEVILWDLNRKELKEITIFVNSMVKDILIDSGKFVDEDDFNSNIF